MTHAGGELWDGGFALESAAARVCRDRVTTNVMVRDLDLPVPDAADGRRLEVVVDGLPLFGGSQLAVDATVVCALRSDGSSVSFTFELTPGQWSRCTENWTSAFGEFHKHLLRYDPKFLVG